MKKILLFAMLFGALTMASGADMVIRVKVPATMTTVKIYSWNDEETITAGWPGNDMTANGDGWYCYVLPAGSNFIFNNGNGGTGNQTANIEGVTESTCYILDADMNFETTTECPTTECTNAEVVEPEKTPVTFTISIKAIEGWDKMYMYAWGDEEKFGGWPGTAMTLADGWYTITATVISENHHLIVNNAIGEGEEGTLQQVDLPSLESKCYQLTITGEGQFDVTVAETDCPSDIVVPQPKGVDFDVMIENAAGWEHVYVYTWGGDPNQEDMGSWPGTEAVLTDGLYVAHVTSTLSEVNVIVNNNDGAQTASIPASDDLIVKVKDGGEYELLETPSSVKNIMTGTRIYPNPVKDIINVEAEGIREISIYNLNGQQIISTTDRHISVETLAAGMYIINVDTENGKVVNNFIKQ